MDKRWKILNGGTLETNELQGSLKIHPALCSILVQRGINSFEKARSYFRPSTEALHDPFLMKDMDKAVERIETAINAREKILVFGDYDVDGTTSVASMYRFLCNIHDASLLSFYIPHRYREGYGISRMGIDHAHANGYTLIIALDCGIKSVELIAYARSLGIDFIVCDHHLPDAELPVAAAILNPKQPGCSYPYKELCGCGVGFKLITALSQRYGIHEEKYLCFLDLVATAIAADIVPMTGENRILAYHGLRQVNTSPCAGIAALIKLGNLQHELTINNVVFVIAPRVNAAGRMDDARKAVELFIETDPDKAMKLAEQLHTDNSDRKEADSTITAEALDIIRNSPGSENAFSTVVYREHWHKGVVGIVASRLIENYYRPTVVLTRSGDVVAGSARSVPGFNLYEAIHACRKHLLGYGGHFAAAGLSLLPDQVDAFAASFEKKVKETIDPKLLIPEIIIDAPLDLAAINHSFYRIVTQMEPFGPENMRPVFIARNVWDTGYSRIVKEQHVKFVLKQGDASISGIGFNLAEKFPLLQQNKPLDIVFTLDENTWNGNTSIQLKMIDFRIAENPTVRS